MSEAPMFIEYANGMRLPSAMWFITGGDHVHGPIGPFVSEEEAHAAYRRNQPRGQQYLSAPKIELFLRPNATQSPLADSSR